MNIQKIKDIINQIKIHLSDKLNLKKKPVLFGENNMISHIMSRAKSGKYNIPLTTLELLPDYDLNLLGEYGFIVSNGQLNWTEYVIPESISRYTCLAEYIFVYTNVSLEIMNNYYRLLVLSIADELCKELYISSQFYNISKLKIDKYLKSYFEVDGFEVCCNDIIITELNWKKSTYGLAYAIKKIQSKYSMIPAFIPTVSKSTSILKKSASSYKLHQANNYEYCQSPNQYQKKSLPDSQIITPRATNIKPQIKSRTPNQSPRKPVKSMVRSKSQKRVSTK